MEGFFCELNPGYKNMKGFVRRRLQKISSELSFPASAGKGNEMVTIGWLEFWLNPVNLIGNFIVTGWRRSLPYSFPSFKKGASEPQNLDQFTFTIPSRDLFENEPTPAQTFSRWLVAGLTHWILSKLKETEPKISSPLSEAGKGVSFLGSRNGAKMLKKFLENLTLIHERCRPLRKQKINGLFPRCMKTKRRSVSQNFCPPTWKIFSSKGRKWTELFKK